MKVFRFWLRATLDDTLAKLQLYADRLIPREFFVRESVSDAGAKLELYHERLGIPKLRAWSRSRFGRIVLAALILAPLLLQAGLIYRYGVNIPITDDWGYVSFVRRLIDGGDWWNFIYRQHNENRYVIVKAVIAVLAPLTQWKLVAQMYMGLVATGLTLWGSWLLYRRAGNDSVWLFVPVAWLLIHPNQFQTYWLGLQFGFLFVVTGAIWTFYFLSGQTRRDLWFAIGAAIFGTFAAASGLWIWIAGLMQLLLMRARWRWVGLWGLAAVFVYAIYFYDFNTSSTGTSLAQLLAEPLPFVQYEIVLLGAPLGLNNIRYAQIVTASMVGVLLLTCALVVRARRLVSPAPFGIARAKQCGEFNGLWIDCKRRHYAGARAVWNRTSADFALYFYHRFGDAWTLFAFCHPCAGHALGMARDRTARANFARGRGDE